MTTELTPAPKAVNTYRAAVYTNCPLAKCFDKGRIEKGDFSGLWHPTSMFKNSDNVSLTDCQHSENTDHPCLHWTFLPLYETTATVTWSCLRQVCT
jgi:hypothetical protein